VRAQTLAYRLFFAVIVAALVVAQPRPAFAKQDWWGWLEEFSGPGPFDGWELSVEVLCINLAQRQKVPVKDYKFLFDQYPKAVEQVNTTFQPFSAAAQQELLVYQALNLDPQVSPRAAQVTQLLLDIEKLGSLLKQAPSSGEIYASAIGIQRSLQDIGVKPAIVEPVLASALEFVRLSGTTSALIAAGVDAKGTSNAETKRQFSKPGRKFWPRSCRDAQDRVDIERKREQNWIASHTGKGGPPLPNEVPPPDENNFVIERRDWQTGIVLSRGWYRSLNNKLFDPQSIEDDEPQVKLGTFEILAHSKVSSSIDIGAGIGVALFRTQASSAPQKYGEFDEGGLRSKNFYVIPLSVVVRPARLFINSRWASIAGYRMSLRYFGDLETSNFALRTPPDAKTPRYGQAGEFVWGAAAFIDGVAAGEAVTDAIEKIKEKLRKRAKAKQTP
jgi:hypothetical protein